jgi:hypothetical protein
MPGNAPGRSYDAITEEQLERLSTVATKDHERFTAAANRRPYAGRRLLVALARGAAQHYLDCRDGVPEPYGVSDFEVWSFYAAIRGTPFPGHERISHKSISHDRPPMPPDSPPGTKKTAKPGDVIERFRRPRRPHRFIAEPGDAVTLRMTSLPCDVSASQDGAVQVLQAALRLAADQEPGRQLSWYLAQKPLVLIDPAGRRGAVIWRPPGGS